MYIAILTLLVVVIGIPFWVAYFMGRKRKIGFALSFYFAVVLPFIGIIPTLLSPNKSAQYEPKKWKRTVGVIFIVWGILGTLELSIRLLTNSPGFLVHGLGFLLGRLSPALFFLPYGIYLYKNNK